MSDPTPFGKYLLLERINVGGMAEVFKAKSSGVEGFERLVAIKRILPNIAEDAEFITMFIDEAKISVQLQHSNVAQIYDLGKIAESYFIAMEFVHGKDVRAIFDRLRKAGNRPNISMMCHVVSKMCEGLDYAHRKRDAQGREMHIVHRDISPQNVLVSYEGEVKVIDFGIAKAANKASKTQAGILKGKFAYMSPEQVRGLPLDRRSDVFSVGIVLYELLTAHRLFIGESDFSTLEKVRNVEVEPPGQFNPDIDQALEEIIMKALAKDIDERYQWCSELERDLQRYLILSGQEFTREHMMAFMRETFAEEIARDRAAGVPAGMAPEAVQAAIAKTATGERPAPAPRPPPPAAIEDASTRVAQAEPEPQASRAHRPPPDVDPPTLVGADMESQATRVVDPSGPKARPSQPSPPASPPPPPVDSPEDTTTELEAVKPLVRPAAPPDRAPAPAPPKRSKLPAFLGGGVALALAALAGAYFAFSGAPSAAAEGTGVLIVRGTPAGAEVIIDGDKAGVLPFMDSEWAAGRYRVEVRHDGFAPYVETVSLAAGDTAKITAELVEEKPTTATLEVSTTPPDATLILDGKPVREGAADAFTTSDLGPGDHTLLARAPGFRDHTTTWRATAGETETLEIELVSDKARLIVTSKPKRAEVLLDGEVVGTTPLTLDDVDATGDHILLVRHDRCYQDYSEKVLFGPTDTEKTVEVELARDEECRARTAAVRVPRRPQPKPPPPPEPEGTGKILLNVKPGWAKVIIDGKDTGRQTPLFNYELPAGKRKITLVTPDGKRKTVTVDVVKDAVTKKIVQLD